MNPNIRHLTIPGLALAALLVPACGESPSESATPAVPSTAPSVDAAAALEATRREEFSAALDSVRRLVDAGSIEKADAALEATAALPGASAETVASMREALASARRKAADRAERAAVLPLLRGEVEEQDPTARAAILDTQASRLRAFLAGHPDDPQSEEFEAAIEAASHEAGRNRDYAVAFAAAQKAMDEGRPLDALALADKAYDALPRQEAQDLRETALARAAPEGMILIPGGAALIGSRRTSTFVKAFYLDRTEVTCAQYAAFARETKRATPASWTVGIPPSGRFDHPVTGVSGEDAAAYAAWAGKRLPTEVEWEKAARGPEGRKYPWGEEWSEEKGHFGNTGTVPAGSRPGDQSWFGIFDMGGNVSELTTIVIPFPDPKVPYTPGEEPRWSVKGGQWAGGAKPDEVALWLRVRFKANEKSSGTGFRCAKSLE